MEGQAGVLQQRVEAPALQRRRIEPRERVGGDQQERVEAERQRRLRSKRRDQRPLVVRRDSRATNAPATASTVTHSSIEPSWFPHAPAIL